MATGNVFASTKERSSENTSTTSAPSSGMFGEENLNWVDTGYSLAMHTASFDPVKFFLIYKYEVYGVEYLNDGNETRDEESNKKHRHNSATGLSRLLSLFGRNENRAIC